MLLQKEVDIGPDETLGDVYFKKLFPMGVDAMLEALDLVRAGKAPKIVQDLSKGSYESWFRKDAAGIDWSKSAGDIYNIIRAANPQPGAWALFNGAEVQFFDSSLRDGSGAAGEIVAIDAEGVTVAGNGGRILLKRVKAAGGQKIPALEWAASAGRQGW